MFIEKIKNIFLNKEKRMENLISFLIILVITLIFVNKILNEEDNTIKENEYLNESEIELATLNNTSSYNNDDLEIKLENILSKISGVGEVSVLITYSESSSLVPIYNVNESSSTTEETDTSGGTRTILSEESQKDVVTDSSSNVITEKITMPQIEGAIVTAEGAEDVTVKSNIIAAVEAATGLANHKIQVFEMGDEE